MINRCSNFLKNLTNKSSSKITLAIFLIAIISTDCSQSDIRPNKKLTCYPTRFVSGSITYRELIYNSNNQIILDTQGDECGADNYYRYDKIGNIISSIGCYQELFYTYDSSNNLILKNYTDIYGYTYQTTYQYNSSGQLISATSQNSYQSGVYKVTTYQYPNTETKNPSKVISPGCCNNMDVHVYEYDNNPNPMKILFPSIRSDNNVIRDDYAISMPFGLPPSSGVKIYTYKYNENGYPISTSLDTYTTTTIYDCK